MYTHFLIKYFLSEHLPLKSSFLPFFLKSFLALAFAKWKVTARFIFYGNFDDSISTVLNQNQFHVFVYWYYLPIIDSDSNNSVLGGVGLNLCGANHLFLLDMHWNPQLESQACDRIYRLEYYYYLWLKRIGSGIDLMGRRRHFL